ncbi:ATP synthase mitochondrial F1 complex assembly factor 1, partial [Lates japonicus]
MAAAIDAAFVVGGMLAVRGHSACGTLIPGLVLAQFRASPVWEGAGAGGETCIQYQDKIQKLRSSAKPQEHGEGSTEKRYEAKNEGPRLSRLSLAKPAGAGGGVSAEFLPQNTAKKYAFRSPDIKDSFGQRDKMAAGDGASGGSTKEQDTGLHP